MHIRNMRGQAVPCCGLLGVGHSVSRRGIVVRPAIRQAEICEAVSKHGEVSVEVLAQKFNTSAETIRRDLTVLADAGQVRKIHGGARAVAPLGEGAFAARLRHAAPAKRRIAETLAGLVLPGMTVFLDTGSTTLICAERLSRIKNLTVITNSTRIAEVMAKGRGGAVVYLLGGRYRGDNAQAVGGIAIEQIRQYRADMAILTIGAIDAQGASDFSSDEADVARAMIKASSRLTVVADHSKFNRSAAFQVCRLERIDALVSNQPAGAALMDRLKQAGVTVYG